jgi:putative Holliday junction resolvase
MEKAKGRIAAIDFGTRRLGIAVTDPQQTLASPLVTYTRRTPQQDGEYLRKLAQEEQIIRFVVGLPVHLDGKESLISHEARRFGRWLAERTTCPVTYFDERFSSAEAEEKLRAAPLSARQRKERRDMLAAQILLTAYLEAGCPVEASPPRGLDE